VRAFLIAALLINALPVAPRRFCGCDALLGLKFSRPWWYSHLSVTPQYKFMADKAPNPKKLPCHEHNNSELRTTPQVMTAEMETPNGVSDSPTIPRTPSVQALSLTEYATNPSPPREGRQEGKEKVTSAVPLDFILPTGYPDVGHHERFP
jgi:hypothetical protein